MTEYLVKFTPLEPYFFGGERNFKFENEPNHSQIEGYFIRSEDLPFQTTLIGAIRYLCIPSGIRNFEGNYAKNKLEEYIGGQSFSFEHPEYTFGKIEEISPLFIVNGNNFFVPTPFNHKVQETDQEYTPFTIETNPIETTEGDRFLPSDYEPKKGMTDSFMNVFDGTLISKDKLFKSFTKIGIRKDGDSQDDAFFKKEYKLLEKGYSFAAFVKLAPDVNFSELDNTVIYLGQNKSAFSVHITPAVNELEKKLHEFLERKIGKEYKFAYAFSDLFVTPDIYKEIKFAAAKIRSYRNVSTSFDNGKKIDKSQKLYRLIKSGSFFILNDIDAFKNKITLNFNKVGFNKIVYGGGK